MATSVPMKDLLRSRVAAGWSPGLVRRASPGSDDARRRRRSDARGPTAERGSSRVLDIALMVKGDDGAVAAVDLGELDEDSGFGVFDGATTGLITQEDLEEAATALNPGTSAAVLVWENVWAAPVAVALRRSGGQL